VTAEDDLWSIQLQHMELYFPLKESKKTCVNTLSFIQRKGGMLPKELNCVAEKNTSFLEKRTKKEKKMK
jgi:hypothetical protein